ncbi:MAG: ankyrin repeat domain-containing protein [Rhodobacteraceae bacterium]|jgi:ankyrin repeat protein|nr:ankyrin repeat domain-containing protein [Paracoccaceae bacterium]
MTAGDDTPLGSAMRAGDRAALDRIARDRPGIARDAGVFLDAVALCPAATVRWCLDNGADPNLPADDGFPSLHLAIDRAGPDRAEVVALLLGHGADADQRGANDWTPLHRAACQGTAPLDIIALLIDSGADRTVRTRIDDFATPEEEARHLGHVKAADFLRDYRGTRR